MYDRNVCVQTTDPKPLIIILLVEQMKQTMCSYRESLVKYIQVITLLNNVKYLFRTNKIMLTTANQRFQCRSCYLFEHFLTNK